MRPYGLATAPKRGEAYAVLDAGGPSTLYGSQKSRHRWRQLQAKRERARSKRALRAVVS